MLSLSLLVFAASACGRCAPEAEVEAPRRFGVYAVWFEGAGDDNRAELDRFLTCLIEGSDLNRYWGGEARLEVRGSWALPAPKERLQWDALPEWLTPHVEAGRLPRARTDETPLYLVLGGEPELWVGACGRNGQGDVAGRPAGLSVVRNRPHCWPTQDRLRSETQITAHELVETVDRVLGYGTCAGGGACRGRPVCPNPCDTFVGLTCPGAPTGTFTGCGGGRVDGWVIQKFSTAGRDPARCDQCAPCDVTVRACPPDQPGCGDTTPNPDPTP